MVTVLRSHSKCSANRGYTHLGTKGVPEEMFWNKKLAINVFLGPAIIGAINKQRNFGVASSNTTSLICMRM